MSEKLEAQASYYQYLLEKTNEQIIELQRILNENNETIEFLKNINDFDSGLLEIGVGVMIKALKIEKQSVLVPVGSGVMVEKSIEEAIKTLNERSVQYANNIHQLQQSFALINEQLEKTSEKIKKGESNEM
jgi:prefoldin alpha subunit